MQTGLFTNIFSHLHPHVLPHQKNNWRAYLIKNPSLFLYLLFLVALTLIFNIISVVKPGILGYASNIKQQDVVSLTNQRRTNYNLQPVTENPLLSQAAIDKANNMFAENYWAHIAPSGKTPWDFIKRTGYKYSAAGENLARDFDQSESVVDAWMASPSHRENLLNSNYSEIGVGVVNGILDGRETTLVVQMFGLPSGKPTLVKLPQTTTSPTTVTQAKPIPTSTVQTNSSPSPSQSQAQPTNPPIPIPTELVPVSAAVASVQQPANRTLINSFQIVRNTSFALLVLLTLLLAADLAFARRRHLVRETGHTMAHFGLLILLLVAIWYTNSGLIL